MWVESVRVLPYQVTQVAARTVGSNLPHLAWLFFCSERCYTEALQHHLGRDWDLACMRCGTVIDLAINGQDPLYCVDAKGYRWCWRCLGQPYPIPPGVRQWVGIQPTVAVAQADWTWLQV